MGVVSGGEVKLVWNRWPRIEQGNAMNSNRYDEIVKLAEIKAKHGLS